MQSEKESKRLKEAKKLIKTGKPVRGFIDHYTKQHTDLALHLVKTKDNLPKALDRWAWQLEAAAEQCRGLAELLRTNKGKRFEVQGGEMLIEIFGDQELLKQAALRGLIDIEEDDPEEE